MLHRNRFKKVKINRFLTPILLFIEHRAGVTGQQRMFSPPRHLIIPSSFWRFVLLWLKLVFRGFFFWFTEMVDSLLLSIKKKMKIDKNCIDVVNNSFTKNVLKITIVRHYVVISWSGCPYIDTDGIKQQYISHSVVCTIHTDPGITCCVSGNLDVISRIV